MIDQLNNKITILTGEIKLLQSDKETGLYFSGFHYFIYSRELMVWMIIFGEQW